MHKPIKVMIVDDSAVVRQILTKILNSDPDIEVIATALDPYIAVKKLKEQVPDVITLDIEMPRMDGITFLKKLMAQHPIPVVICSSLAADGAETTLNALQAGAVGIIHKASLGIKDFFAENQVLVCDAIKAATKANLKKLDLRNNKSGAKLSADAVLAKPHRKAMTKTTNKVVLIGASTGGTEALSHYLQSLPPDGPGTAVVQHMPAGFTKSFSDRLNGICKIEVKEAEDGDGVFPGRVLIAPGNKHMLIKRSGARYYVEVKEGPLVNRHRPAVDVLFRSGAQYVGPNAIGVIMTGMGDDGAKGMLELKEAGSYNIAQDEDSCVVFGMPKEAIKLGSVDQVVNLHAIAETVLSRA